VEIAEKQCTKCAKARPVAEFNKNGKARDGLDSYCKPCNREKIREWTKANQERKRAGERLWHAENMTPDRVRARGLRLMYGITVKQWEAVYAQQGGLCAGCGANECPTGNRFHVDHDHACCPPIHGTRTYGGCGRCIRGLLCVRCNTADVLAGKPYVNWSAMMAAYGEVAA
jgi:hypothetical protein